MKPFQAYTENEVGPVDQDEFEPSGWVNGLGEVIFNTIDGGDYYSPQLLREIADYAEKVVRDE